MMTITRRHALLLLPLGVAACADETPLRTSFPPLRYGFLTPLRLNVADIDYAPPPEPGPLDAQDPAPPAEALLQMAHDRLVAGGSLGKAVFVIDQASIERSPDGLAGSLAVHLDILTSEGTRTGFAEAKVSRRASGIGDDLRGALYDITSQMMQDMNVEFEYQIRRSLHDWLQTTSQTVPPPPAVEQQALPAPGVRTTP